MWTLGSHSPLPNRCVPSLIELSSDNLKMVFQIVEAYLYLSPEEMMSSYSNLIVTACLKLFVELRTEGVLMILKLVEIIFRLYPAQGKESWRGVYWVAIVNNFISRCSLKSCFVLLPLLRGVIYGRYGICSTGGFLFESAMPLFQAQNTNKGNFANFDQTFCR